LHVFEMLGDCESVCQRLLLIVILSNVDKGNKQVQVKDIKNKVLIKSYYVVIDYL
jgi:hypothetical protein